MPFGIPTDENNFWNVKELAYQHTHMFYGFWISYFVFYFFPYLWIPCLFGLLSGICMEVYQYRKYIMTLTLPKSWVDSVRDLCFWFIGGCLNYIIILF
jgi:hypothetical protein